MHSFWFLFVAAAAIIGVCIWRMRRPPVKRKIRSAPIEPDWDAEHQPTASGQDSKAAALKTISAEELRSLACTNGNYILVDVACEGQSTFAGHGGTFVLSIVPGQLPGVLEWLPADRAVVFRGVSDSARALIEQSVCMVSSKPRCVLSDLPVAMEVL